jgi:MOSC domain-containing protein YiiM
LQEGDLATGDNIILLHKDKNNVTINDIVSLYLNDRNDEGHISKMKKASKLKFLPEPWKIYFGQKITQLQKR